jgi:hypothetical protein
MVNHEKRVLHSRGWRDAVEKGRRQHQYATSERQAIYEAGYQRGLAYLEERNAVSLCIDRATRERNERLSLLERGVIQ